MAVIDPAFPCLTLINTFTVAPEKAQDLADLLVQATEETMQHLDGFVSATVHVAFDRQAVANYAQWRDLDAFEAMLDDPAAQDHMNAAAEMAESFQPVLYEAVHSTPKP